LLDVIFCLQPHFGNSLTHPDLERRHEQTPDLGWEDDLELALDCVGLCHREDRCRPVFALASK